MRKQQTRIQPVDYGTIDGGTLIDLVMRMERCSNGEAMQKLEQHLS